MFRPRFVDLNQITLQFHAYLKQLSKKRVWYSTGLSISENIKMFVIRIAIIYNILYNYITIADFDSIPLIV